MWVFTSLPGEHSESFEERFNSANSFWKTTSPLNELRSCFSNRSKGMEDFLVINRCFANFTFSGFLVGSLLGVDTVIKNYQ